MLTQQRTHLWASEGVTVEGIHLGDSVTYLANTEHPLVPGSVLGTGTSEVSALSAQSVCRRYRPDKKHMRMSRGHKYCPEPWPSGWW